MRRGEVGNWSPGGRRSEINWQINMGIVHPRGGPTKEVDKEVNKEVDMVSSEATKRLVLTVGLPRSGKTTWAQQQGHPIVNPDSIRLALHGQRFAASAEPFVWAIAYLMVDALFKAGHDTVIVDATNTTAKRRAEWKTRFATVELHVVGTSPDECIRRARAEEDEAIIPVIERMASEWDLVPLPWTGEPEIPPRVKIRLG